MCKLQTPKGRSILSAMYPWRKPNPLSRPQFEPTAFLPIINILINSVLSAPTAKFHSIAIKDFYLNTTLLNAEYLLVPISLLSPDIVDGHNYKSKVYNYMVYGKVI